MYANACFLGGNMKPLKYFSASEAALRCTAVLAIVSSFSLLYGIISYSFAYYGEMMTYLGMTLPMDVLSLTAWLKNPYNGNRSEVRVSLKPCHLIKYAKPEAV